MKIYNEAAAMVSSGTPISEVKSKLCAKYNIKGVQLAVKIGNDHKAKYNLEPRYVAVEKMVDAFIATGSIVSGIRDIWYQIKHKIQVYQYPLMTEKDFSDAVVDEIGTYLWKLFTTTNQDVYNDLGITTKRIQSGSQPIVLFVEKELPDYEFIQEDIEPYIYLSSGQPNLFEFAQLAESLQYDDNIYLVTMTDYDPAGLTIAATTFARLQEAVSALNPYATVHHIEVDIAWLSYPTYQLSKDQVKKSIWDGFPLGVELNAVPLEDRQEAIVEALDSIIDLDIFEELATQRRKQIEFNLALEESEPYQQNLLDKEEILDEIRTEINDAEYDFDTDRFDSFEFDKIVIMAERV